MARRQMKGGTKCIVIIEAIKIQVLVSIVGGLE